ncbi:MAG: glutamate 5-kinase, partial [Actinobacteria bacterium]|nr:glutamate 5-kinase [Actinomycetota bacterium]NIS31563.1 glutamate 5-kinase [Actinomycetota bacterium]NIU66672.1 glutamate 5-kinase [Actinomycetota bacterium]NIV87346.1 glutamate 5-kinase [Actinomycetota bacterium]NIW28476.1 glutamate 5-kinase [Actinomycetota bacterium]
RLAAIVSHLVGAGMLVILTDTAGLYSADPQLADDAELIDAVRHTDDVLDELWKRSRAGV